MKNIFLIACFSLLLSCLSVTAVMATQPGCDASRGGMLDVMQNHASALRVQDRAYAREIIKRNDPSLGLTCFDQALGLTSRLGLIFSDDITIPPALPNASVFQAPIQYPLFGAEQWLLVDLNTVITPVLNNYLDDFTGTLSEPLGTTIGNWLMGIVRALSGTLSAITDYISTMMGFIGSLSEIMDTINEILRLLGLASPLAVASLSALFNSTLTDILDMFISTTLATISSFLTPLLSNIIVALTGSLTDMNCNRIDQIWNGGSGAPGGFVGVEGSGIESGTPYFNFEALVGRAVSGGGFDLMDELANTKNSAILRKALSDLKGPLSAPGIMPSWKAVPVIPAGASVTDIIKRM